MHLELHGILRVKLQLLKSIIAKWLPASFVDGCPLIDEHFELTSVLHGLLLNLILLQHVQIVRLLDLVRGEASGI